MADLTALRNQIRVRAYFAVSAAAPDLQSWLKATSPRVTGQMQNATTVTPRALTATAKAATPYASYVRVPGTKPHVIRAKKGRLLSFYWPIKGRRVAYPRVNHPGYRGSTWWDVGLARWPDMLRAALRRAPNG